MSEFDQHAQAYSSKINKALSPFGQEHEFYVRVKVAFLLEAFSQARSGDRLKALDVGCGVGLIHPFLAKSVDELHAVDVSEDSLAIARQNNPSVQYRAYDGLRLPYADGTFDCAFAIGVMHHVPVSQWKAFAVEMARVVRP